VEPAQSGKKAIDAAVHDNALNLLANLLGDEGNVSKLLIIKHTSAGIKLLIKKISKTAQGDLKILKKSEAIRSAPKEDQLGLPPGEKAAREAIAKTKEHQLLHSSGTELEFQLLLSQAEALNYGAHLARIVAENDSNAGRASQLSKISQELNQLYEEVLVRLRPRQG
jgi:hypothetical protein